ncbi:hypothetical protein [Streptomyces sp. NPDC008240]
MRDDLVAWDKANGDRYGFDVEGLEFAPGSSPTAYVGFRAPVVPP